MAVEAAAARHDTTIFVHENKLLVLPNTRGACSSVVVLYPDSGRYQLYALDYLNKVRRAAPEAWLTYPSGRERAASHAPCLPRLVLPCLRALHPLAHTLMRSHSYALPGVRNDAAARKPPPPPCSLNVVSSVVGRCAGDQRAGGAQVRHRPRFHTL